ncbi:hypothetical protein BDR03DRAFT_985153 [Suillus americanus]|nr:hypothetical protein BDR03DRAFT_985153 [Suillus americanus]
MTFRALEYFQILSFELKASALEFYHTVIHLTDNTGIHIPKCCVQLALIQKRTCLMIGQMLRPNQNTVDPGLNHGYAFLVEETSYKSFLNSHGQTLQKVSRGLAATGTGTINYARHNFKRPNSVSDLQKGESMQSASALQVINISYNIACQWSKNLWMCMSAFPQRFHLDHDTKTITFLVPKFHLPAHVFSCQTIYSFNFIKGVGRTDGKAPEHGWADINPVATSTHEMGPGSRCDTLDDHFNDWNWKKVCLMGKTLACKVNAALPERLKCTHDLHDFEAALDPSQLACWKQDIEGWESDRSKPNPFELKVTTLSKAEADEMEHGTRLELEDQQWHLKFEGKKIGQHAMDSQQATLLQCVNYLRQCINTWSRVQLLYMSCISQLHLSDDIATKPKVHKINLLLPSVIPTSLPCFRRMKIQAAKLLDRTKDAVPLRPDDGTTVGQQTVLWIWKTRGVSNNMEYGLQDCE